MPIANYSRLRKLFASVYANGLTGFKSEERIKSQITYRMANQAVNAVLTGGVSLLFLPLELYLQYALREYAYRHVESQFDSQNFTAVIYPTREAYFSAKENQCYNRDRVKSGRFAVFPSADKQTMSLSIPTLPAFNGKMNVLCAVEKRFYDKLAAEQRNDYIRSELKNSVYREVLENSLMGSLGYELVGVIAAFIFVTLMPFSSASFLGLLIIGGCAAAGNLFGGLVAVGCDVPFSATTWSSSLYSMFHVVAGRKIEPPEPVSNGLES